MNLHKTNSVGCCVGGRGLRTEQNFNKYDLGRLDWKLGHTCTVKHVLSGHSKRTSKLIFKIDYRLMQVKSIAEKGEHSATLFTFIQLPFAIKIFVLSIFEWSLQTGYTVCSRV